MTQQNPMYLSDIQNICIDYFDIYLNNSKQLKIKLFNKTNEYHSL